MEHNGEVRKQTIDIWWNDFPQRNQDCILQKEWHVPKMVMEKLTIHNESNGIRALSYMVHSVQFSSVQFTHSVMFDTLRPHESHHGRPPCPSPTPRVYSNSSPSSRWCHPTMASCLFTRCQLLPCPMVLFQLLHYKIKNGVLSFLCLLVF